MKRKKENDTEQRGFLLMVHYTVLQLHPLIYPTK